MRSCYFAPVTVLADIDRMLCKAETLCDDVAASIAVGALTPVISFYFAWSVSHIRMVGLVLAADHHPKRHQKRTEVVLDRVVIVRPEQ